MIKEKINIRLPFYMKDIIENDSKAFGIYVKDLFYRLLINYSDEIKAIEEIKEKKSLSMVFNLDVNQIEDYEKIWEAKKEELSIENESDFIRTLIKEYIDLPLFEREKIIFKTEYEICKNAIKKGKKILFGKKEINPCYIISNNEFNYIICYRYSKEEKLFIYNHRLSKLNDLSISDEKCERIENIEEQKKFKISLKKLKSDFDPFLSVLGEKVIIKFHTKEAIEGFERAWHNRPNFYSSSKKKLNDYDLKKEVAFLCSKWQAEMYFSQFIEGIEVIKPIELREKFKLRAEKMFDLYK